MKKVRLLHNTTLAAIIGIILIVSSVRSVQADNLKQQLDQSKQQVNQLNGVLKAQKDKVTSVTTQVLALKQSVQALNSSLEREQVLLSEEQKNLNRLKEEQKKLEDKKQEHIKALGKFLKNNHEEGMTTYLAVLFEARSWSDFFDRADKIQTILGSYSRIQSDILALNETMNSQMDLIQQKQGTIQASIQNKVQTQQTVQEVLNKQQTILAQLSADERVALNATVTAQAKVSRIQKLIEQEALEAAYAAQEKSNPASGTSRGANSSGGVSGTVTASGGAQKILNFAAQFLGTPYVWGGTKPAPGFDCSGYVQYVYRNSGISLSRVSEQQFLNGVSVSRSQILPGDLVFYSTYSSGASHVGIYIGSNTMIHSSSGGVSYDDMTSSYWTTRFLGARRVLAQ